MSVAASSMNHEELMSDLNFGISPKSKKKSYFDLEMFGSNKPLKKTNTVVLADDLAKAAQKKKKIQALNKVIDLSKDNKSDSESSSEESDHPN